MSNESTGGRSTPGEAGSFQDLRESERRSLARMAFTLCQLGAELQELAEAMSGNLGDVHYGGDVALPVEVCARQGVVSGLAEAVTCGRCAAFLVAAGERRQEGEPALSFEIRRAAARIERAAGPDASVTVWGFAEEDPRATSAELGYQAIRAKAAGQVAH